MFSLAPSTDWVNNNNSPTRPQRQPQLQGEYLRHPGAEKSFRILLLSEAKVPSMLLQSSDENLRLNLLRKARKKQPQKALEIQK